MTRLARRAVVAVRVTRSARLAVAALAALALAAPAAHAQEGADAITVTREEQLSPRLKEFGLTTPALEGETNLRVLLPDGYDADPARRYPVLYLLHGCCDYDVPGSRAWTTHGEAEEATAGLPLIVVMPDGGRGGFYSDWYHNGLGGTPMWETYHIGQLMPWIDRRFRTNAAREGRAVAGLSMGGFGTMSYAARHPDLFVAAASFSGAVDTNLNPGLVDALAAQDRGEPGAIWGMRATEEVRWRGHNPWDLAENLRPLQLALRTGNGEPGPYDDPGSPRDPVEQAVHDMTVSVHERLAALGIAHTYDNYGPGTHKWPYWARSLRASLAEQMRVLADPPAPPARVAYVATEPAYEVFGWRVAIERPALAFSRLADAGRDGFTLAGSGAAEVTTPASYPAGAAIPVSVHTASAVNETPVTADAAGRLRISVALGTAPDAQAKVRIALPAAPAACAARVVTARLPRGLRRVHATVSGRRVAVRGRRVRFEVRGQATLVVRARTRGGRSYRLVRRYRACR